MLALVQLLLFGLRLAASTTPATWRHCADLPPLDLLSFVLERDTSKPVPGVHIKQAAGLRGLHFSSPHTAMSFPASQLLVNCDLFPQEFSIVLTLKVSSSAAKRNEYIFTLMEPGAEEPKDSAATDNRGGRAAAKNRKKRGRLVLGLRLSRKHLHFLFRGHAGATENWGFSGANLADNQWHTLVLAVGGHRVSLTVDCRIPLEIVPARHFPSSINLQGSRFHVGSRGKWKGLYSGLMRQLVLVPGADATHHICPSSNPQLAALSVPPILLDLPVTGREGDSHLSTHNRKPSKKGKRVEVGPQRPCSETLQGELWFNAQRRGLYLCDGTAWIAVLQGEAACPGPCTCSLCLGSVSNKHLKYLTCEDRKRLDYLVEHQVLETSSETHDIEVFQVPGVGLMAAMAQRSTASGSAVYMWNQTGFQLYQNISTYGALAWRHFTMGKKTYLVVSNFGGGPERQSNRESPMDFSVIYKWSKKRKQFVTLQTLRTHCARDWEAFKIDRRTYLAVANHRQGDNNHTINSVIYKWNRSTKSFEVHQLLPTFGAYDWEFFTVGPYHFLVVANAFDGVTTSVDSVIYVWVNGSFHVFQTIKTFCATDWEMFHIGSRVFLVVANGHRLHLNGPSQYAINSTIYELDVNGQMFVRFQDIVTYSAVDWEFFSLGEESFLVVANSFNGESYSLNSILYRWQGYEGFVPVHWLPTIGCSDWEFFTMNEEAFLIYSSAKAPLSKVFKLKTY